MIKRSDLTKTNLDTAIQYFIGRFNHRLQEKGMSICASSHEILGIITEEYDELKDAVRQNNSHAIFDEMIDIAIGCLYGCASMLAMQDEAAANAPDDTEDATPELARVKKKRKKEEAVEEAKKIGLEVVN